MKSVIAIVGRPNVGKSTLFNRITRSRNALVADRPGITRDRQYGPARYAGRSFLLIDTGGLGENKHDSEQVADLMEEQSLLATKEADIVLWLVDGRAGLSAIDETLAGVLRPLHKQIYLVINKTEGMDTDMASIEFHSLGMGDPWPVSAKQGHGIDDLLDDVVSSLTEEETVTEDESEGGLKITVIGKPNVGKSTLVNRMLGEERMLTFDQPGTTRDSIVIPFERANKPYTLIDTAGVRRKARVTDKIEKFSIIKSIQAIDFSNIVILVVDAHEGVTEQDASLLGMVVDSGKSLIIAVNKWDGLDQSARTRVRGQIERKFGFVDYACNHFISALHGSGVGNIFDSIDHIGRTLERDISTSEMTSFLYNATEAHPPPMVHGRRIKLRYAHFGGHNPIRIIIHGNQPEQVPESYRRYLAKSLRNQMHLEGTPVMIEFKRGDNPFKGKKNILTQRQINKRKRMLRHVKKH
jgi:GTP-binding protein